MAKQFKLQFLRNEAELVGRKAAVNALNAQAGFLKPGEPAVAIYKEIITNEGQEDEIVKEKILLAIKLHDGEGVQIFEGATFDGEGNLALPEAVKAALDNVDAKIATLNADENTTGSIAQKIKDATDPINAAIDTLNGAATEEGSVAKAVKDAVAELKYTDTAVAGQYVSQVSEANGVVSVERLDVAAAALNGYVKGEDATAVAATDTINGAIGKLENRIDAAKTAITTEIEKLNVTDAAVDGKFVTAVSETDGKIEVTRGEVAAEYVTLDAVGEGEGEGKINLESTNVQDFAQEIFNKTIENEQVAANAINSVVEVLGSDVAKTGEKIEFNSEKFANTVINGATSFADADFKLAKAIEAVKTAMLTIDCGTY